MARPNKEQLVVIQKRNKELLTMVKKGYPSDYICSFFNLSKGRVSQIIKKNKST
jgi:hypothetical protein